LTCALYFMAKGTETKEKRLRGSDDQAVFPTEKPVLIRKCPKYLKGLVGAPGLEPGTR
jgi:hypothetical protein